MSLELTVRSVECVDITVLRNRLARGSGSLPLRGVARPVIEAPTSNAWPIKYSVLVDQVKLMQRPKAKSRLVGLPEI